MTETIDFNPIQTVNLPEVKPVHLFNVAKREEMLNYLDQTPVGLMQDLGLDGARISHVSEQLSSLTATELTALGPFDLSAIAAGILMKKDIAKIAKDKGIDVSLGSFDVTKASSEALAVIELCGGIITDEEKQKLQEVIFITPAVAMERPNDVLYGKVLFDEEKVMGILVTDREHIFDGGYTFQNNVLEITPTSKTWQRKIAHELVHAIKIARQGEEAYSNFSDDINEGMAAIVEYITGKGPDSISQAKNALEKTDLVGTYRKVGSGDAVDVFGLQFMRGSTYKTAEGARKIIELAQITKEGINGVFSAYLEATTEGELAEKLTANKGLGHEQISRIKTLLES